jgi:hypothetical protein
LAAGVAIVAVVALATSSALLTKHPAVQIVSESWPRAYGSIGEIAGDTQVVISGTVTGVVRVETADPAPRTIFQIAVDRNLKGTAPQKIEVSQDGAMLSADQWVEIADFPLMMPGDHVLLFLRPTADGPWAIVGGPQGRLAVAGDNVEVPAGSLGVPISPGTTIDQVATAIGQP